MIPRRRPPSACPSSRTPQGVRGLKYRLEMRSLIWDKSHPARGAWIEIQNAGAILGLYASHPARGAWIEMFISVSWTEEYMSHPARGAWIEISAMTAKSTPLASRTPQGVRGLK